MKLQEAFKMISSRYSSKFLDILNSMLNLDHKKRINPKALLRRITYMNDLKNISCYYVGNDPMSSNNEYSKFLTGPLF